MRWEIMYSWGISCVFKTSFWFLGWGIFIGLWARFVGLLRNCNHPSSNDSWSLNPYFLRISELFPWLLSCIIYDQEVSFPVFPILGEWECQRSTSYPLQEIWFPHPLLTTWSPCPLWTIHKYITTYYNLLKRILYLV